MTSTRYDEPDTAAKVFNAAVRRLAEVGISISGSRALRVVGRKTGMPHDVVVNVMTVDGVEYLVSPRGDTQWARNARAVGAVAMGPRWRRRRMTVTEISDAAKPVLLQRYLKRWYWEVKGHVAGLTPESSDEQLQAAAASIPVFALSR